MTFHAASREAFAAAELKLLEVLESADKPGTVKTRVKKAVGAAAPTPQDLGGELFAVVRLLEREVGLRRALGDASSAPQRREELLTRLLSGKVGERTLDVLRAVVAQRWSTPRELLDGIDELGRTALLVQAEQAGRLDAVEDELFRFGRIVAANTELEQALSARIAPEEAKSGLVRQLLGNDADPVTVQLVEQLVVAPRGRAVVAGLDDLAAEAAKRRERSVAYVVAPVPLSEQQEERLAATLQRIYSRPIALHVEIDPEIKGGLVIKVGDEVIDGSATGRLDELRRRLAG